MAFGHKRFETVGGIPFTFLYVWMSGRPSHPLPPQEMGLADFPPELLTKIFLNLSYKSLLCVLAVSAQWNIIVATDSALGVQMFKKVSKVYVEPGVGHLCAPDSVVIAQ